MPMRDLIVTGASSQIGYCVLRLAAERGTRATAISRRHPDAPRPAEHIRWLSHDLRRGWPDAGAPHLVHAAPLELLPPLVASAAARGVERLVAFSSTSVLAKRDTPNAGERVLAHRLAAAEAALADACRVAGVAWTVLRPTLIYGVGMDRNLASLAAVIRRLRCLPLPRGARGRRQPVHAADLATISLHALETEAARRRVFILAGGSTLSYREMVEALFHAQNLAPRILPMPASLCRAAVRALRLLPRFRELHPALVDRMAEDLVFDDSEARRLIGWDPRSFDARDAVCPPPGRKAC